MDSVNSLMDTFNKGGIEVSRDEALARKEELENSVSYMMMSDESKQDLRNRAVRLGIIPSSHKDAEFDKEKIQENIRKMQNSGGHKFRVINFDTYYELCMSIINTIRNKKIPNDSFLIGAPNGFGKQSFVTDCLLASLRNGWITVPYISLTELGELKAANDKKIMRGLMGLDTKVKKKIYNVKTDETEDVEEYYYYIMGDQEKELPTPETIFGMHSWSKYINAPILLCFFSGIESKMVESQVLKSIVTIRSAKGYPTIAMISDATEMYSRDPYIGKYIWREIVMEPAKGTAIKPSSITNHDVNRLIHISTFKNYILQGV